MAIELSGRFQTAIDRAAMVAGKQTYDQYIEEWRRTTKPCGENVEAEAETAAARVESEYPIDRLSRLAANGGLESPPSSAGTSEDGQDEAGQ